MDKKTLTYGLIGLVLLAIVFGLGYWIGNRQKPVTIPAPIIHAGKPDTVIVTKTKTNFIKVYVEKTQDNINLKVDTTITNDDITIKIKSDDIVGKGLEIAYELNQKYIYITKTDTLLTYIPIPPEPEPFYENFLTGYITGTVVTGAIVWVVSKFFLK